MKMLKKLIVLILFVVPLLVLSGCKKSDPGNIFTFEMENGEKISFFDSKETVEEVLGEGEFNEYLGKYIYDDVTVAYKDNELAYIEVTSKSENIKLLDTYLGMSKDSFEELLDFDFGEFKNGDIYYEEVEKKFQRLDEYPKDEFKPGVCFSFFLDEKNKISSLRCYYFWDKEASYTLFLEYDGRRENPPKKVTEVSKIGDSISNEWWGITLGKLKQYNRSRLAQEMENSSVLDAMEDDQVALIAFFSVKNISDRERKFDPAYIRLMTDGSDEYLSPAFDTEIYSTKINDYDCIAAKDVKGGEEFQGYILWIVPQDWIIKFNIMIIYQIRRINFGSLPK